MQSAARIAVDVAEVLALMRENDGVEARASSASERGNVENTRTLGRAIADHTAAAKVQ
jgi:hypothetical protein